MAMAVRFAQTNLFSRSAKFLRIVSPVVPVVSRNMTSHGGQVQVVDFKTLQVTTPKPFVFHIILDRPKLLNAMNKTMWIEIKNCFEALSVNQDCRAIVLSGAGKHFSAGIDLTDMAQLGQDLANVDDIARKGVVLERTIKLFQDCITSLELCPKPVISAVHSACIGAGLNLITAADVRYCSEDAFFQLKEVILGMAADVGALQRLPKCIGSESLARELAFTGRRFDSFEAKSSGLVSKVFPDKDTLLQGAIALAEDIAEKSPVAVQATKDNMIYSQIRSNQEGLDHIRRINTLNLQSEDFANGVAAQLMKEKAVFSKL